MTGSVYNQLLKVDSTPWNSLSPPSLTLFSSSCYPLLLPHSYSFSVSLSTHFYVQVLKELRIMATENQSLWVFIRMDHNCPEEPASLAVKVLKFSTKFLNWFMKENLSLTERFMLSLWSPLTLFRWCLKDPRIENLKYQTNYPFGFWLFHILFGAW